MSTVGCSAQHGQDLPTDFQVSQAFTTVDCTFLSLILLPGNQSLIISSPVHGTFDFRH